MASNSSGLRRRGGGGGGNKAKAEAQESEKAATAAAAAAAAAAASTRVARKAPSERGYKLAMVILTLLAFVTRFYRISHPAQVVFDEVHFGKVWMSDSIGGGKKGGKG